MKTSIAMSTVNNTSAANNQALPPRRSIREAKLNPKYACKAGGKQVLVGRDVTDHMPMNVNRTCQQVSTSVNRTSKLGDNYERQSLQGVKTFPILFLFLFLLLFKGNKQ